MSPPRRALLGLGSNLGPRAAHLRAAVAGLGSEIVALSSVYETEPVGGPDQGAYLNMVVVLRTSRSPRELLEWGQSLEQEAERVRTVRWGPRTLDVDVLWIDDEAVDDPDLVVPHPRMFERGFVMVPVEEVAPDISERWTSDRSGVRRLGRLDELGPGEERPAGVVRPDGGGR